jgi:hypothetical protein
MDMENAIAAFMLDECGHDLGCGRQLVLERLAGEACRSRPSARMPRAQASKKRLMAILDKYLIKASKIAAIERGDETLDTDTRAGKC